MIGARGTRGARRCGAPITGQPADLRALNTAVAPFNDSNLRRAVFAALNRKRMGKVRGGAVVSITATHFLYPGVPGFAAAGGHAGPGYDFTRSASGNMAVARAYMKKAGYPNGKYTGAKTVVVVGVTGAPAAQDAAIVNQTLQSLGFKTNFKLADQSAMYTKYCGRPKLRVNVCPNVGWVRDFADPQTVLAPTFEGSSITQTTDFSFTSLK